VDLVMVVLRLVHVVFGVFWAGSMFFVVSFLLPTARDAGPGGAPFMRRFARSSFVNAAVGSAVLTILSGLVMFWLVSSRADAGWMGSPEGITLSLGALAALIAFGIGLGYQRPAAMRLAALAAEIEAAGGAPSEAQQRELPAIQARMMRGGRWIATLLLVAVVCMGVFRYV
jgi:hypothetical protein